ncbi:acetylgalactosaminyl-O-glycosyl-glycoprotein beta-1,3-N-acetylglucosaminyltransferase-like, partial [Python bivittatus]|uniref:Hexosyltransferase n=1 Tax=Python bivittatus TaxID=176946 RepID=A0A9F5J081_PYTBI
WTQQGHRSASDRPPPLKRWSQGAPGCRARVAPPEGRASVARQRQEGGSAPLQHLHRPPWTNWALFLRLTRLFISRWYCLGVAVVLLVISALRNKDLPQPAPAAATLTDGTFTFHFNWSVYEALYPHLQHYQCQEVIARDSLCQGPASAPLLLLAIKSHPASGSRRAALRRTWARPAEVGGFWLQPLFLLGAASSDKHAQLVEQESRTFGDILMWDFAESHHNLSLKERCLLRWVHQHCQRAAYIFRGEDGVFVNAAALTGFLRQTPNASHFIHGNIQFHPAVKRIGRDAVPLLLFPSGRYPHFASEEGFVVPGPALPALYRASAQLPTFPLSGAYWGLLALAAELPHQHSGHFRAWEPAQDHLTIYQQSLVVHSIPMERMEQVWQELRASVEGRPE